MGSPPPGELSTTALVLAILVLIIARRTYLNVQGARYSPTRMFAFVGWGFLFFALFAATTLYAALGTWGEVSWLLIAAYAGTATVVALRTVPHVRSVVRFEERNGVPYYRLPWLVPVLYLVLYTARLIVEIAIFGLASVASFSVPSSLPAGVLGIAVAFDLLYAVSVGLLLGRVLGVRSAYLQSRSKGGTGVGPRTGEPLRSG